MLSHDGLECLAEYAIHTKGRETIMVKNMYPRSCDQLEKHIQTIKREFIASFEHEIENNIDVCFQYILYIFCTFNNKYSKYSSKYSIMLCELIARSHQSIQHQSIEQ